MGKEKEFECYLESIRQAAFAEGFDSLDETFVRHLKERFWGEDVVVCCAERFVLREMKMSDLEKLYCFPDAESERVLAVFLRENRQAAKEFLKNYIASMYPMYDFGIWAVEKRSSKALIGLCGLGLQRIHGEDWVDLGYYIAPSFRKQGYASEAVALAIDYAKNYLQLDRICAIVREDNIISVKVLEKTGFEEKTTSEDRAEGKRIFVRCLSEKI